MAENTVEMAQVTGQLSWSVMVTCPKCYEIFDLADNNHDDEGDLARWIFSNDWDAAKGFEIICENEGCGAVFAIGEIEY